MNVFAGIVGLANVGKSTLFNALLKKQVAQAANYPFTTIEPNVGVVEVPDEKLEKLAETVRDSIASPQNDKGGDKNDTRGWVGGLPPIVPATVRFVDIAGLVKGAHKGEGLGNQFLSHIREVDVIIFVLRDFSDENVIKTGENPKEDLEVLQSELLLKDLETLEKKTFLSEAQKSKIKNQNDNAKLKNIIEQAVGLVSQGRWLRDELSESELEEVRDLQLLSAKKMIVVVNSDESSVAKAMEDKEDLGKEIEMEGAIKICAKMEEELAGLSDEEQKEYLKELGVVESGLEQLIKRAYETLNLMSFYTAGVKEVRAWTIKKGSLAPAAAGVIHTDFQRGFIAADIVHCEKFIELGGWQACRSAGAVKTIGKSEMMPADCIVEFKFNV